MRRFNFHIDDANLIRQGADPTDMDFIEKEIRRFLSSERRRNMIIGERYHEGKHDILHRKREMIGANGDLEEVKNLPNNRIVDNQYKKMVDQKVNYFLGKPFKVQTDNEQYAEILNDIFNRRFLRLLKNVGENSFNCGMGWMFLYYDENGEFTFRRFKPYEVIAGWGDDEHTRLDYAIRIYEVIDDAAKGERIIQKVEVYHADGISRFEFDGAKLRPDPDFPPVEPYFTINDEGYNWNKMPLIPFKYNSKEIPLIMNVKVLQDGLNTILSNFQNNMEEDSRNTILIIVNYDGENLGEFRKNLATFGAVNVRAIDGVKGGVESLQIEVNAANYQAIIKIFKDAIMENAMGFDAKDDKLGRAANQMNIQSMYTDIDIDTNRMEIEYQASFEDLLYFVNLHLVNVGMGDFEGEEVEIIFNRDMMMNEGDIIGNIKASVGIISEETLIANHPWVDDPQIELKRLDDERAAAKKEAENMQYGGAFGADNNGLVTKDPQMPENSGE